MFPATVAQFVTAPWVQQLKEKLNPGGAIYNVIFVGLIWFFTFFYTEIVMNPVEIADNLKKGGKFIPASARARAQPSTFNELWTGSTLAADLLVGHLRTPDPSDR